MVPPPDVSRLSAAHTDEEILQGHGRRIEEIRHQSSMLFPVLIFPGRG